MQIVNTGHVDRDEQSDPSEVLYRFDCILGRWRAAEHVEPQEMMDVLCNAASSIRDLVNPGSGGRVGMFHLAPSGGVPLT